MPYDPRLIGQPDPNAPPSLEDYLAGLDQPELDTTQEAAFNPGRLGGFLEGLQGLNVQTRAPQNFGEGLVGGLGRGLGMAGTRIAQAHAKYDAAAQTRQQARNAANLEASRNYRNEVQRRTYEYGKDRRTAAQQASKDAAQLARDEANQPLEVVQTPQGSRYAPRSKARGMAPGEKSSESQTNQDIALTLTPAGLDAAAKMYARTGQLPAMGMGKNTAGVRTRIINRAAEIDPELNIAANKAGFESTKASLTNVRKIRDSSRAFEQTALKNADVLEGTLKKLSDTGSPWLNRPLRALQSGGRGDPDVAAFNAAIRTVTPEFARLLSSPTASGQLSDTARKEIESILSPNATPRQILASLSILRQDARNRTSSYDSQVNELEYQIKTGGKQRPPLESFVKP